MGARPDGARVPELSDRGGLAVAVAWRARRSRPRRPTLSATQSAPEGVNVNTNGLFHPVEIVAGRWSGAPSGSSRSSAAGTVGIVDQSTRLEIADADDQGAVRCELKVTAVGETAALGPLPHEAGRSGCHLADDDATVRHSHPRREGAVAAVDGQIEQAALAAGAHGDFGDGRDEELPGRVDLPHSSVRCSP